MAITYLTIPSEIIVEKILPLCENKTFLSIRLVSKVGRSLIYAAMTGQYDDITLGGKEVKIVFSGPFKKRAPAFFQYRRKMAALARHPELLVTLGTARSILQSKGTNGPYKIGHFFASCSVARNLKGHDLSLSSWDHPAEISFDDLALSLIPFDTSGDQPTAIWAAVRRNSIELVNLVFSHPGAKDFDAITLEDVFKCNPTDLKIRHAILSHRNAVKLREQEEPSNLQKLQAMLLDSENNYSFEDYSLVFDVLPKMTQHKIYELLCVEFKNITVDYVNVGMGLFRENPKSLLKVLPKLTS